MSKIIDTKGKIEFGDEFPKLAIGDKLFEVNDLKVTADKIDKVLRDEKITDKDRKVLEIALGKDALQVIDGMNLKTSGFVNLVKYVMATVQGVTFEEFEKMTEEKN